MGTTFTSGRAGLPRAVAAMALAAGLISIVSVQGAGATGASTHNLHTRGAKGTTSATSTSNLIDHGGKVLPASHTYVIWWGNSGAWASDVQSGIASLFNGFQGSQYLGIAQQYMRTTTTISSTPSGVRSDSSPPPKQVNASTLGNEVVKEFGSVDANGIYFVYTSNFPRGGNFCAWHSYTTSNGTPFSVAYMPNTTNVAGCDPGNLYGVKGTEGLRSLANVTAHEFMESVTDTLPANGSYGWIDSSGSEIGDKCAWQFSGPVTLGNSTTWQLQEEWDNSSSGCAQG